MSNSVDVNALLTGAMDEGALGAGSLNILNGLDDLGLRIQAALGTPADSVQASEAILVRVLMDDSPSMMSYVQDAIDGYNLVIDAQLASKQKAGILFGADFLNGGLLCPYMPLDHIARLSLADYHLMGGTPLFSRSLETLATVIAKTQEFSDNGVPVRSITLIVTDGYNNQGRGTAAQVATVIADMMKAENHIVAAMGIAADAVGQADFRKVFQNMGIRPEWILTPKNTPSEIRKAWTLFSNSAVRASQNAANFSSTQVGGFGN